MIRLASLLAVEGDLGFAVGLLRSADDLRRLKGEAERLRLFGILLILYQPREALRRAVRWVRGQRNEVFIDLLVDQLVLANRADTALALVREVGTPGDPIALMAGELMLALGQQAAARTYLRGWLENARVTNSPIAARFIRAALDASDPELAFAGAQQFGLARVPQAEIALMSEAMVAADRLEQVEALRQFMRPETQVAQSQPRPGARRPGTPVRRTGPTQPAMSEPARELEGWRLALWTRLMTAPAPGSPAVSGIDPALSLPQLRPGLSPARARATTKILRNIGKARVTRAKAGQQGAAPAAQPATAGFVSTFEKQ